LAMPHRSESHRPVASRARRRLPSEEPMIDPRGQLVRAVTRFGCWRAMPSGMLRHSLPLAHTGGGAWPVPAPVLKNGRLMRRGPKPAKSKEAKLPVARKSPKDDGAEVRDLEKRLAEAQGLQAEAQEQQGATAEILRVISSSPGDLQRVFDTIVERAVRLCNARLGALLRFDGQMIHLAAHAQQADAESVQALQTMYPRPANTTSVSGRALLWGRPVHVHNMREDPELAQVPTAQVGHRTVLSVPMMREGSPIGAITVARAHLEPFSD